MSDPLGVYEEHRVPDQRCPVCGYRLTAASSAHSDQTPPKGGDLTVCIGCASILRFREDLALQRVTSAEALELDPEICRDLARLVVAIRAVRRRKAQDRHRHN